MKKIEMNLSNKILQLEFLGNGKGIIDSPQCGLFEDNSRLLFIDNYDVYEVYDIRLYPDVEMIGGSDAKNLKDLRKIKMYDITYTLQFNVQFQKIATCGLVGCYQKKLPLDNMYLFGDGKNLYNINMLGVDTL